jgi:anti-sigma regulatory factor (Ser/Thr protein kinase)
LLRGERRRVACKHKERSVFTRLDQSSSWPEAPRLVSHISAEIFTGRAHALGRRGDPREVAHATAHVAGSPTIRDAPPPEAIADGLVGPFEAKFVSGPDAPMAALARATLRAWMAGHVGVTIVADAELLVVELVANSVRRADAAADAAISVRAHLHADALCLEVGDRGMSGSILRLAPDLERGGGFGLNVVEALSRRWGVHRDAGTHVWAELAFRIEADR